MFCWTRLPMEVRRLAARKEDLFRGLLGDTKPAVPPGASSLLELLEKNKVGVGRSHALRWLSWVGVGQRKVAGHRKGVTSIRFTGPADLIMTGKFDHDDGYIMQ